MHAQALKEMTIIRVYHRAAPREVGQDGNPVFSDAELPGLCIVAGGSERGIPNQLSAIQITVCTFSSRPTHVVCRLVVFFYRYPLASFYDAIGIIAL